MISRSSHIRVSAVLCGIFLGAAGLLATALPASAIPIVQARNFSISGIPGFALTGFNDFDPALGTLDSVNIQIFGQLGFSATVPAGSALAPIVDFNAQGLAGQGFSFSGARFFFPTEVNPTTAPVLETFVTTFSMFFNVTALSDLIGFIAPSAGATLGTLLQPPLFVVAQRDDFIENIPGIDVQEQFLFFPVNFTPVGGFSGVGSIIATYEFTPAPLAFVPEPGAMALFGIGVAGLALARRRRAAV